MLQRVSGSVSWKMSVPMKRGIRVSFVNDSVVVIMKRG